MQVKLVKSPLSCEAAGSQLQTPVALRMAMHRISPQTSCTHPPVGRSIMLPLHIHFTAALSVAVSYTSKVHPGTLVALCVSTLSARAHKIMCTCD